MSRAFFTLFRRDLRLASRGHGFAAALGFFLLAASMAPLAFGTDPEFLREAAPALFWLLAVLAALLGLEGLFRPALENGDLDNIALSPMPLSLMALSRLSAYWLVTGLPLALCVFPAGLLFGMNSQTIFGLFASMVIGTPGLILIGGAIAALAAGLRQAAGLVVFLTLPFYAPALIFGPQAANALAEGQWLSASPLFLLAFTLQALAIAPFLSAAALRQYLE